MGHCASLLQPPFDADTFDPNDHEKKNTTTRTKIQDRPREATDNSKTHLFKPNKLTKENLLLLQHDRPRFTPMTLVAKQSDDELSFHSSDEFETDSMASTLVSQYSDSIAPSITEADFDVMAFQRELHHKKLKRQLIEQEKNKAILQKERLRAVMDHYNKAKEDEHEKDNGTPNKTVDRPSPGVKLMPLKNRTRRDSDAKFTKFFAESKVEHVTSTSTGTENKKENPQDDSS
jgi:hypothetical protein